jgi:hypothetical protein
MGPSSSRLATGVTAGNANITATSGSISGSTTLTVTPILVSLAVTVADPVTDINTTTQFTATGTHSDNSTQDLTKTAHWSSSSSGVATINNGISGGGLATAKGAGTTTINATFQGEREYHSHRKLSSTVIKAGNRRVSFSSLAKTNGMGQKPAHPVLFLVTG